MSLQDHVLTISGERKREEEAKDERFYRMERSYGTFHSVHTASDGGG